MWALTLIGIVFIVGICVGSSMQPHFKVMYDGLYLTLRDKSSLRIIKFN